MMRRRLGAATALFAGLCLAACGGKRPDAEALPPAEPAAPYRLQPGDRISIKFFNNPELNENVVVRPDGAVTVQVIGDVPAAGRTPAELAGTLEEQFTGELAKPRVVVIVRALGSHRVYVGGEVNEPGALPLRTGLTVMQAIQEAGGLAKTANDKVVLIRQLDDGRSQGFVIDLKPLADGATPGEDVALAPADIVHVPRSGIADANLVVEQYIRNMLPIQPAIAIPF